MDNDEDLGKFLGKVLRAGNAHELGAEVLSQLREWKNEIDNEEQNSPVIIDSELLNIADDEEDEPEEKIKRKTN
ncbi:hypothetical protein SteCoe_25827 [Stentor coeruleus]|uniref:Uncharacterized protein n=1 Tax=Stentor coeruleus TaxID=5963 RepID=A0A1R2BEA2_9CILI|nr:hypothetical protein SteCoe_25827 [Stentor coeruleus]